MRNVSFSLGKCILGPCKAQNFLKGSAAGGSTLSEQRGGAVRLVVRVYGTCIPDLRGRSHAAAAVLPARHDERGDGKSGAFFILEFKDEILICRMRDWSRN